MLKVLFSLPSICLFAFLAICWNGVFKTYHTANMPHELWLCSTIATVLFTATGLSLFVAYAFAARGSKRALNYLRYFSSRAGNASR